MATRTKTLALVACASSKRAQPASAADLYVSDLFRKSRAYAERHADAWFVLSAQHGLVDPAEVLEPYDLTLATMGVGERRVWAQRVWARLDPLVETGDTVVFLAGARYRDDLVPLLRARGVRVEVPMQGLRIGEQLAWLNDGAPPRPRAPVDASALHAFYDALARLAERRGSGPLRAIAHRTDLPTRGVYFFLDRTELRSSQRDSPRVVRVGTHALKHGSTSTLTGRLRQHLGTASGNGNHRGSIFRLHVGAALLVRDGFEVPTWGSPAWPSDADRTRELDLEQRVSRYLGALEVLVIPVLDDAGPESLRGYVERNAIGLLSTMGRELDPPSDEWLGRHSVRDPVRRSGLWNVRHVGDAVDGDFVARFARLVEAEDDVAVPPRRNDIEVRPRVGISDARAVGLFGSPERSDTTPGGRPTAATFRAALAEVLEEATQSGAMFVDVSGRDLHRRVGGYPGPAHAMATCCSVMRSAMKFGDNVLAAPPRGVGPSLTIRYVLPR